MKSATLSGRTNYTSQNIKTWTTLTCVWYVVAEFLFFFSMSHREDNSYHNLGLVGLGASIVAFVAAVSSFYKSTPGAVPAYRHLTILAILVLGSCQGLIVHKIGLFNVLSFGVYLTALFVFPGFIANRAEALRKH